MSWRVAVLGGQAWQASFVLLVWTIACAVASSSCNVPIFGTVECHPAGSFGCSKARFLAVPTFDNGSFVSPPRVFENVESCICKDGFTGVLCDQPCPMAPMYAFLRGSPASFAPCRRKHIQLPFLPAEACGQVFRHKPECRGCNPEEERVHHQGGLRPPPP